LLKDGVILEILICFACGTGVLLSLLLLGLCGIGVVQRVEIFVDVLFVPLLFHFLELDHRGHRVDVGEVGLPAGVVAPVVRFVFLEFLFHLLYYFKTLIDTTR